MASIQGHSGGGPIILATRSEKVTDGVFGRKVNMDLSSIGIELKRSTTSGAKKVDSSSAVTPKEQSIKMQTVKKQKNAQPKQAKQKMVAMQSRQETASTAVLHIEEQQQMMEETKEQDGHHENEFLQSQIKKVNPMDRQDVPSDRRRQVPLRNLNLIQSFTDEAFQKGRGVTTTGGCDEEKDGSFTFYGEGDSKVAANKQTIANATAGGEGGGVWQPSDNSTFYIENSQRSLTKILNNGVTTQRGGVEPGEKS